LDENTRFYSTIIDDPKFVDYVLQFTKDVPEKIRNKMELERRLLERNSDKLLVAEILSLTRLPE
jgi:hypothetical protein